MSTETSHGDSFSLSGADHPGLQLTNKQFDGDNFTGWSRSARMAFGARLKLGFIDGSCAKPDASSDDLHKWLRCHYMVRCWLLNSIVPTIAESLMYVSSAKELWSELAERFREAQGPLIYQLNHDLVLLSQGNDLVSIYYLRMKKYWDELQEVDELPRCVCEAAKNYTCNLHKKILNLDSRNKLFQFLMV